jgi:hypothetical protein
MSKEGRPPRPPGEQSVDFNANKDPLKMSPKLPLSYYLRERPVVEIPPDPNQIRVEQYVADLDIPDLNPENALERYYDLVKKIHDNKPDDIPDKYLRVLFEKLKDKIFLQAFAKEIQKIRESLVKSKATASTPELIKKILQESHPESYVYLKDFFEPGRFKKGWSKVATILNLSANNLGKKEQKPNKPRNKPIAKKTPEVSDMSAQPETKIIDDLNPNWAREGKIEQLFKLIAEENINLPGLTAEDIGDKLIGKIHSDLRTKAGTKRSVIFEDIEYVNLRKTNKSYSFRIHFKNNLNKFKRVCNLSFSPTVDNSEYSWKLIVY